jgi:hypothetical protein
MRKERNDRSGSDCAIGPTAHVIGRSGLAIAGLLCGFFVATHVVRADIAGLDSIGLVASMSIAGAIGFYLGGDIPRGRSLQAALPGHGGRLDVVPVDWLGAIGTFLSAAAALTSVYVLVFDEVPILAWSLAVGFCWLLGAIMQIGAGVIARRRTVDQSV